MNLKKVTDSTVKGGVGWGVAGFHRCLRESYLRNGWISQIIGGEYEGPFGNTVIESQYYLGYYTRNSI